MSDGGMGERMILPARKLHAAGGLTAEQCALVETLAIGCHAVNRGQDKRTLFYQESDYQHFIDLMTVGRRRYSIRIHSYNLIANHFHQVLTPPDRGAVSAYLQWVEGRYGCHLRQWTYTVGQGHVFQHRFWAETIGTSPVHLFKVL